jgi:GT2 family glycosyltransferase
MGIEETNSASRVTVVTVTYGERRHFLEPMLRAALAQGVEKIILVNNGAPWDVAAMAATVDSVHIEVFHLGKNMGSAGGFAKGISVAHAQEAELIWLLDDDSLPQENCLEILLDAYKTAIARVSSDRLAVVAFRPDHNTDVIQGINPRTWYSRPSSFLGFHVLDIPLKFWQRTSIGRPRPLNDLPLAIHRETAPYSGMLSDRTLIDSIGLPKTDLVLYADDIELTWRLTRMGGVILLIPKARMIDMEGTWNVKHTSKQNSFMVWLQDGGDFRAYYSARNLTWIGTHLQTRFNLIYITNKLIYLAILYAIALANGRLPRFMLILQAIKDGENCHLGINPEFPLP